MMRASGAWPASGGGSAAPYNPTGGYGGIGGVPGRMPPGPATPYFGSQDPAYYGNGIGGTGGDHGSGNYVVTVEMSAEIEQKNQEFWQHQQTRASGALKVIGGILGMVGSGAALTAGGASEVGTVGASTPVSAPAIGFGLAGFVLSEDVTYAGLKEIWTGQPAETGTHQLIRQTTGSQKAADWGEAGVMLTVGSGEMYYAGKAGQAARLARVTVREAEVVAPGRGVWDLHPFQRGVAIERQLGQNLPGNFPVIDRFQNGVATSIKSMDLAAPTYRNAEALTRTGQGYVDAVAGFQGKNWARVNIEASDITGRALELAVPPGATEAQQQALQGLVKYGTQNSVTVKIVVIP
jgi:hypothetical protein